MKLSVIVPMYNSENTIKSCLLSIVESFKDEEVELELVVVDDGSKDESIVIVKELMKKITELKLYENEWGGVSKARNTALTKATGDYIMFVDSDDQLLKWQGGNLKEILSKKDDLIFLETAENYYSLGETSKIKIIREFCNVEPGKNMIQGPMSKFFKKDFIESNEILFNTNLRMGEDLIFNLECLSKYNQLSCYDCKIYRKEQDSSMHLFKENNLKNEISFKKEYTRILDGLGNSELNIIKDRFAITGFLFLLDRYYAPALVEKKLTYREVYSSMRSEYKNYKKSFVLNNFDFLLNRKDTLLRNILAIGALRIALFFSVLVVYKRRIKK